MSKNLDKHFVLLYLCTLEFIQPTNENYNSMEQNINLRQNGEIILYQPDNSIRLEVRMEEETVWLNRQQSLRLRLRPDPVGAGTHHPHRQNGKSLNREYDRQKQKRRFETHSHTAVFLDKTKSVSLIPHSTFFIFDSSSYFSNTEFRLMNSGTKAFIFLTIVGISTFSDSTSISRMFLSASE